MEVVDVGKHGPSAKPTALRVLRGDRADRINDREPVPPVGGIVCPERASDGAREIRARLAPDLEKRKVLTTWDVDAFLILCETLARYRNATALVNGSALLVQSGSGLRPIRSPQCAQATDRADPRRRQEVTVRALGTHSALRHPAAGRGEQDPMTARRRVDLRIGGDRPQDDRRRQASRRAARCDRHRTAQPLRHRSVQRRQDPRRRRRHQPLPRPRTIRQLERHRAIDASSGYQRRHRLSRAGNRRLNRVLHITAIVQLRHDTAGRAYYRRKVADGKSPREAIRREDRQLDDYGADSTSLLTRGKPCVHPQHARSAVRQDDCRLDLGLKC